MIENRLSISDSVAVFKEPFQPMSKAKDKRAKSARDEEKNRGGMGRFHFKNGDSYEGEYIVINNKEIYRHGYGVYKTKDLDEYRALWEKDCIVSDLSIKYSNNAGYTGEIDMEGAMSGEGTYVFADGTSVKGMWENNQPVGNCEYRDPLGHKWMGKTTINENDVIFSPENHIWEEKAQ